MAHQYVPFVKTNDLTPHEAYAIAYWDWLRGIRPTIPSREEFGICACAAEYLGTDCHQRFEKAQVEKAIEHAQAIKGRRNIRHYNAARSGVR